MELWLIAGVALLLLAAGLLWLLDALGMPNPFVIAAAVVVVVPLSAAVYLYRYDVHLIGFAAFAVLGYVAGLLTPRRKRGARDP